MRFGFVETIGTLGMVGLAAILKLTGSSWTFSITVVTLQWTIWMSLCYMVQRGDRKQKEQNELATKRERERIERDVFPRFKELFWPVLLEFYDTDRIEFRRLSLERMKAYGYDMGVIARDREECWMTQHLARKYGWPIKYRMTLEECDKYEERAYETWSQALACLAAIDPEHAESILDWRDMEPYASYLKAIEGESEEMEVANP